MKLITSKITDGGADAVLILVNINSYKKELAIAVLKSGVYTLLLAAGAIKKSIALGRMLTAAPDDDL